MPEQLISPHGGALVDLVVTPQRAAELKEQSRELALVGPRPPPAL